MTREITTGIWSFLAGAAAVILWQKMRKEKNKNAGAVVPGEDLSLFYGDERSLTTVHDHCKYLDSDLYAAVVRHTVVCCVDIVLVRRNPENGRRECVLAVRSSEPAKGVWWWPGGRLLKGETFFDTAVRKAKQETGLDASQLGYRPDQGYTNGECHHFGRSHFR
eukprot:scaffold3642_cov182-Amphora_coffeaeformis.AAC.4